MSPDRIAKLGEMRRMIGVAGSVRTVPRRRCLMSGRRRVEVGEVNLRVVVLLIGVPVTVGWIIASPGVDSELRAQAQAFRSADPAADAAAAVADDDLRFVAILDHGQASLPGMIDERYGQQHGYRTLVSTDCNPDTREDVVVSAVSEYGWQYNGLILDELVTRKRARLAELETKLARGDSKAFEQDYQQMVEHRWMRLLELEALVTTDAKPEIVTRLRNTREAARLDDRLRAVERELELQAAGMAQPKDRRILLDEIATGLDKEIMRLRACAYRSGRPQ